MPHCLESRFCSSYFQVREARTFLFNAIAGYFCFCFTILEIVCYYGCMGCLVILFGMYVWLIQVRTVARTDNLTQASLSRLGEISRGLPMPFYASCRSGDQILFWARECLAQARGSHLSENVQKATVLVCRALA